MLNTRQALHIMLPALVSLCVPVSTDAQAAKPATAASLTEIDIAQKIAGQDISAYLVSEKLDGIYAHWDGQTLRFKSGRIIHAPSWFTQNFPAHSLAGELWTERGQFERVSGIVRQHTPQEHEWRTISFNVFDIPNLDTQFSEKISRIDTLVSAANIPWLRAIPQQQLADLDSLTRQFQEIVSRGGEGLMLRKATEIAKPGHAKTTIKLKPFDDAEGTVIGYEPVQRQTHGHTQGQTGALIVRLQNQRILRVGSGLTDALRSNPPPIGSQITYRHRGYTNSGLPRFATYWRTRGEE